MLTILGWFLSWRCEQARKKKESARVARRGGAARGGRRAHHDIDFSANLLDASLVGDDHALEDMLGRSGG